MVVERTAKEVAETLARGGGRVLLVDVREPEERDIARIEPSILIPMGEVADRTSEIPRDRDVIIYCHHGHRSMAVASYLESEGFDRVINLEGGIDAWSRTVDPRVPRY